MKLPAVYDIEDLDAQRINPWDDNYTIPLEPAP